MSKKTKNINPLHITRMPFRIMLCNNQQLSQMARKLTQWYCFGTVSNQLLLVSFYQIVLIHNKPAVWSLQRWQRISQCISHKYDSWVKSGRWGETRKETKTKDISALWFLVGLQNKWRSLNIFLFCLGYRLHLNTAISSITPHIQIRKYHTFHEDVVDVEIKVEEENLVKISICRDNHWLSDPLSEARGDHGKTELLPEVNIKSCGPYGLRLAFLIKYG